MDPKNLPGPLKLAILIQSLGQRGAEQILRYLRDDERQLLQDHMSQLGPVSPQLIEEVAKEFTETAQRQNTPQITNATGAAPHEQASNQQGPSAVNPATLKAIESLDVNQLVDLIKVEHPQTIAIIITHLNSPTASDVLSRLPDEIKTDVALRIANLDKVISGMVEEIDRVFEDIMQKMDGSVSHQTGGVDRLAELLNNADEISGELILNEIEDTDPDLAEEIKQRMFVFEDLVLVDDRGFQKVLRRVESRELAVAMKAATAEVKDKIFRNMSQRAGDMLKEEIEALGSVRMKEVTDAQQGISKIIQDMESKGELIISGRRGEEFVS
jgi:flagellar motor switch protein FliG